MRKSVLLFVTAVFIGACSTPKYSYNFDYYDYNSGKKDREVRQEVAATPAEVSPLALDKETITASSDNAPVVVAEKKETPAVDKKTIAQKLSSLSKGELKELKKDVKAELKKFSKEKKELGDKGVKATKEWDHDLKMAAIFGAVGLVLSLFAGVSEVFWILAVVALVIGIVFLIKWLARQ